MTFAEIDGLYLEAADLVARHRDRFMPIFDQLADEREKALARGSRLQEALTVGACRSLREKLEWGKPISVDIFR